MRRNSKGFYMKRENGLASVMVYVRKGASQTRS